MENNNRKNLRYSALVVPDWIDERFQEKMDALSYEMEMDEVN